MMKNGKFITGLISASVLMLSMPASAFAQAENNQRAQRWGERGGNSERMGSTQRPRMDRGDTNRPAPSFPNRATPQRPDRVINTQTPRERNDARPEGQRWNGGDRNRNVQQRPDWQQRVDQHNRNNQQRPDWQQPNNQRNQNDQRHREWQQRNDQRNWNDQQRREWQQRNDQRNWNDRQRREWQERNRYTGHNNHSWNQNWRQDRRYDWQNYRHRNQSRYRYAYNAPRGWDYGYRRFSIGISLWSGLFASNYWINDPYQYRLPPAYGSLRWIRYYDDVMLVDTRNGYVVDIINNFFW